MGEIIPFRKRSLKEKHRGKTLCRHGHHKWVVEKESQCDVKEGWLVTVYRGQRCDKRRVKAH